MMAAMAVRVTPLLYSRKFLTYTWIGAVVTALDVLLIWLAIDVLDVATVPARLATLAILFFLKYLMYCAFGMVGK